jgi:hypothetical protein
VPPQHTDTTAASASTPERSPRSFPEEEHVSQTAPENVAIIRRDVAASLITEGYSLPNNDYDEANVITVEGDDTEFRLVITEL